jgi:hypothetical protein
MFGVCLTEYGMTIVIWWGFDGSSLLENTRAAILDTILLHETDKESLWMGCLRKGFL